MSGETVDRDAVVELLALEEIGAEVLVATEAWIVDGLGTDAALALAQNALPLTEGAEVLTRLQRRSFGRVLLALLLLVDDPAAGELATRLVELLDPAVRPERVLAG